jgi:hypothetical protein
VAGWLAAIERSPSDGVGAIAWTVSRPARALGVSFVAFALLVHLPALWAPLMLDDHAQRAMVEGRYPLYSGSPFDLYDFISDANRAQLLEHGIIPWWTQPGLVVRFFRPLSSALVWLDHVLFGRLAVGQHVHSLLWWALASVAVLALLRRALPIRVALIGTAIFALAPCHAVPLVWIANREVLLSTALGSAALLFHLRWREEGRGRYALLALVLFAVAMSAGEYTLCFGGYVLAIELVRRRDPVLRRMLGVACFALPAIAYFAAHRLLGYGAHGSGFYRDPLHDFGAYAIGAPRRLAVLLGVAWLGLDDATWSTASLWVLGSLVVGAAGALAIPLARAIRVLDAEAQGRATWLLLGSLLSLAPVLAVEPFVRVLPIAMIGVSALVALVVDRAWFPPAPDPRRGAAELAGLVALWLGFAHIVRAPLDTWLAIRAASGSASSFADKMAWIRDRTDRFSTIVVLRADSGLATLFAPLMLDRAAPDRWRVLSVGAGRALLLRTGERTLELVASPVALFPIGPRDLFRDFDGSLRAGDEVGLGGMRATVLQLDDQAMPRRLRFDFDGDLDSPSILWLIEGPQGFREQKLPRKGYGEPLAP